MMLVVKVESMFEFVTTAEVSSLLKCLVKEIALTRCHGC